MIPGSGKLICLILNHLIQEESWAIARLRPFSGSLVEINAKPLALALTINEHGLFSVATDISSPDVVLTLPPDAAGRFLADKQSLMSSVQIAGSVDLAETLGFIFRNLRWDIEADLAKALGDIPARRLSLFGAGLFTQVRHSLQRTAQNISEFMTEDSTAVTPARDLCQFGNEVNTLRDDVARLERRIRSL